MSLLLLPLLPLFPPVSLFPPSSGFGSSFGAYVSSMNIALPPIVEFEYFAATSDKLSLVEYSFPINSSS